MRRKITWGFLLAAGCLLVMAAAAAPLAAQAPTPAPPGLTAEVILRRAARAGDADSQALENYTWLERDREYSLNAHGRGERLVSDKTYWVNQVEGVQYRSWVGQDGHPLSPSQQAEQARKWAAFQKKIARASPGQRRRAAAKLRRQRQRMERIRALVPEAFVLQLCGIQRTAGGECYVISGVPRPGFHAKDKTLKLLAHFSGTLWIDTRTYALVRARLTVLRPVAIGWILARIGSGGVLDLRQAPVDGHWFPREMKGRLSARLLWVKGFHIRLRQDYFRYRRMRVTTQVIPILPQG
ncbi:MAG: hypothetical protein ACRD2F_04185 [Terriglobales bacterium]